MKFCIFLRDRFQERSADSLSALTLLSINQHADKAVRARKDFLITPPTRNLSPEDGERAEGRPGEGEV